MILRDRRGRLWYRRIDTAAAVRIRDLAAVDVCAVATGETPLTEPAELVDCLAAVFWPDLVAAGLTPEMFGRRLRGVPAADLMREFFDGLTAFFRMPGPPPQSPPEERDPLPAAELWQLLYRSAGVAGVDPGPLTFGEIARLSEGRERQEWTRAALLIATVGNTAFNRPSDPLDPAEIDPTGAIKEANAGSTNSRSMELTADTIADFAGLWGAF